MKSNPVKARLRNNESCIGTWLSLPDPTSALLMANLPFDWLTLNLEHMPIGVESAALCYSSIAGAGTVPLARVVWNTGENIKRAVDNGAWGVVVPMVCTRQEAESAVESTFYAPLGNRSVGGMLHAVSFGAEPDEYYRKANEEILLVVQIEHVRAIENAEAILSVPGIDAFFVGPNDLLKSMGKDPGWESDEPGFLQALEHLLAIGRRHGVAAGIHVARADQVPSRLDQGFRFLAVASEAGMMLSKAQEIATTLGLSGASRTVAKY